MLSVLRIAGALACAMVLAAGAPARAAEIKVISSNAVKTALEQLAPAFEQETGHKLVFTFGAGAPLKAKIETGASFEWNSAGRSASATICSLGTRHAADIGYLTIFNHCG